MKIELLFFDGCPNWVVADDRLAEALAATGHGDVVVVRKRVETPQEADRVGFTGSPTILLDGTDPFATGNEQVGMACRVYTTPDGPAGAPTLGQVVGALS